jgi:hypothetical protein
VLLDFQITLTRDSVCMADDMEDHTEITNVDPRRDPHEAIMSIAKKYLPNIMGYGHTWDCILDEMIIGIIHGNCAKVTLMNNPLSFSNCGELHFKYHSSTY